MLQLPKGLRYRVETIENLPSIAAKIKKHPVAIGLDLETTGLNPRTNKVVTIQFGTVKNAIILDCRPYYTATEQEKEVWRKNIAELLYSVPLAVGHNLKFDWKFLCYHFGVKLNNVADTMLQELVLYGVGMSKAEDSGISVNMFDTAYRYDLTVEKEQRSWFIGLDNRPEWNTPLPDEQLQYCAQDVYIPLLIHSDQLQRLEEKELARIAQLENMCLPAMARMELDGCYVDREKWGAIITKKKQQRDVLEKELQEKLTPYILEVRKEEYDAGVLALEHWKHIKESTLVATREKHKVEGNGTAWGEYKRVAMAVFKEEYPRPETPKFDPSPINLGSHVQLKIALSRVGIDVLKTDREHLAPYKKEPVVKLLLEWKGLDKFINAFGDGLLEKIESDGRIRPNYNQIGAATGRMSCSSPNWQQLPSHEPEETSVRKCVVAEPGNVLLTADFSNIELRILAELSQDTDMLEAFARGEDLHSKTARIMFGLPDDSDPKTLELKPGLSYRSVAKTINFGLVYGMSPVKLAHTLGVSKEEAEGLFKKYFEAYPGVATWLKEASTRALEIGYSETIAGRKRFYNILQEPKFDRSIMTWDEFMLRRSYYYKVNGGYERQAKNAPIQGTNADITKYAMAILYKHLPEYVKIVACVHDEIVLECPEEKKEPVSKLLAAAMFKACRVYLHTVAIPPVDVEIETYWKKG